MEVINTEILVSSLFQIGFDKVDAALFTYTLAKISMEDKEKQFTFIDKEFSPTFEEYVDYNGIVFKIKDGYSIVSEMPINKNKEYPLGKMFNSSKKLIDFLSYIDFTPIILKKAETYNVESLDQVDENIFSKLEIEILEYIGYGYENNNSLNKKRC